MRTPRRPISSRTRYAILSRDNFTCQACGSRAPHVTLQIDHIVAVANGGSDDEENLQTLCTTCNFGKSDSSPSNVVPIRPGQLVSSGPVLRWPDLPDVPCRGDSLKPPVLWLGVEWAVTGYGIQARNGQYAIEKDRLWQDEPHWGWVKHMKEKGWVDMDDFCEALEWAREHFKNLKPKGLRA